MLQPWTPLHNCPAVRTNTSYSGHFSSFALLLFPFCASWCFCVRGAVWVKTSPSLKCWLHVNVPPSHTHKRRLFARILRVECETNSKEKCLIICLQHFKEIKLIFYFFFINPGCWSFTSFPLNGVDAENDSYRSFLRRIRVWIVNNPASSKARRYFPWRFFFEVVSSLSCRQVFSVLTCRWPDVTSTCLYFSFTSPPLVVTLLSVLCEFKADPCSSFSFLP